MNRDGVIEELDRAAADFRTLVLSASDLDLGRRSHGTRWTNRQLLFHLLFGYQIVFVCARSSGPSRTHPARCRAGSRRPGRHDASIPRRFADDGRRPRGCPACHGWRPHAWLPAF